MLRSRSLLCADDTFPARSTFSENMVLLAALGVLIASPPSQGRRISHLTAANSRILSANLRRAQTKRSASSSLSVVSHIAQRRTGHRGATVLLTTGSELTGEVHESSGGQEFNRIAQKEVPLCKKKNMMSQCNPMIHRLKSIKAPNPRNPTVPTVSYTGANSRFTQRMFGCGMCSKQFKHALALRWNFPQKQWTTPSSIMWARTCKGCAGTTSVRVGIQLCHSNVIAGPADRYQAGSECAVSCGIYESAAAR